MTANVVATGGASTSVTWLSSDSSIATVDANGVVTGVAVGDASITATSDFDSNVSGSVTVVVSSVMQSVNSVSVSGVTMCR